MLRQTTRLSLICLVAFLLILALIASACTSLFDNNPYLETFDEVGSWGVGNTKQSEGQVKDGVYELHVKDNHGVYYATAGENFANGTYIVEATQIDGPLNNGYGLVFRVDENNDNFYAFEISGDGYVWIGYCSNLCLDESVALVGGDWFRSPAVKSGLLETNRLRIVAEDSNMTFFVNGVEVGRTTDPRLSNGDIGVMVEALGERGVRVAFDNIEVQPQ